MKKYVVVYMVCGIHYRYRCYCKTVKEAKSEAKKAMGKIEILEVYVEY